VPIAILRASASVALIAVTASTVERWRRSWSPLFQFRLSSLLLAVATVAAILAIWRAESAPVEQFQIEVSRPQRNRVCVTAIDCPRAEVRWPILFGVACTIYTVLRLSLCAASWSLFRLRSPRFREGR